MNGSSITERIAGAEEIVSSAQTPEKVLLDIDDLGTRSYTTCMRGLKIKEIESVLQTLTEAREFIEQASKSLADGELEKKYQYLIDVFSHPAMQIHREYITALYAHAKQLEQKLKELGGTQ